MMIRGGDCLENLHHQQYHLKPNQQTTNQSKQTPGNPSLYYGVPKGACPKKGDPNHLPYGFLSLLDIPSKIYNSLTHPTGFPVTPSLGHRSIRKLRPTYFHNPTSNCNTNLTTKLYGCFLKWWYLPKHPKKIIFSRKTPWVCWGNPPF